MAKIALITGANRGLGFETARQLGREGITTIVAARDAEKGAQAVERLCDEGIDAHAVELDVTSGASVRAAAQRVRGEHGRLDILVNNAGILPEATAGSADPMDADVFRETYETNVFGAVTVITGSSSRWRRSPTTGRAGTSSIARAPFPGERRPHSVAAARRAPIRCASSLPRSHPCILGRLPVATGRPAAVRRVDLGRHAGRDAGVRGRPAHAGRRAGGRPDDAGRPARLRAARRARSSSRGRAASCGPTGSSSPSTRRTRRRRSRPPATSARGDLQSQCNANAFRMRSRIATRSCSAS